MRIGREPLARGEDWQFNGQVTVHMNNGQFKEGPIALQFGNRGKEPGGTIRWRKMQIRPL